MKGLFFTMFIVFFAFSLMACVSTKAVRLGEASVRPTIPWKQVKVFRSADQVLSKYEEIALLVGTGDSLWTSEKGMWNSMRRKAAAMGANAIILDATSEPSAGTKLLGAVFLGIGGDRKGKAIAIYIHPEEK